MGGRHRTVREKVELLDAALEAAGPLGNVSLGCRSVGISRDTFYRWRRAYESRGKAALRPAPRQFPSRRVPPAVEAKILRLARERPEWGKARVARELPYRWGVSATGVRAVWLRHGLQTQRLRGLPRRVSLRDRTITPPPGASVTQQ